MPERGASGLTPLRSWVSLDIAAHLDEGEAEAETGAELPSTSQSWSVMPSCLPRLWSSHELRTPRTQQSDSSAAASHTERSPSPVAADLRHLRSMGIVGRRLSSPKASEQGSGYFTIERESISQARILPIKQIPGRPRGTATGSSRASCLRSVSPMCNAKKPEMHSIKSGGAGGSRLAWYAVMVLSCGVAFISYLDRTIMGVTILPMAAEEGYSKSVEGFISSAFFLGYTLTNVAAGYLADRYSSKVVLEVGVWTWSLFTMLTPLAAQSHLWVLLLTHFLTGVGEGVTFPGLQMIIANWVDDECNSRAISFVYSGATLGAIAAYLSAPFIVESLGWPAVFTVYGMIGFAWVVLWSVLVSERPAQQQALLRQEGKGQSGEPARIPYRAFATCLPLWAIILVETSHGIVQYVAFFWQPTYYVEVFSGALEDASLYSTLPWMASAVFTNVAGWAADALIARSALSLTSVRKLMEGLSCFGAAACLLALAVLPQGVSVWVAVGLFMAMQSFAGCHVSGAACQHLDINARYAAAMYGLTNGLSTVLEAGGIAGSGYILETRHSWSLLFAVVAGLHVLGGLVYICFSDSKARFQNASGSEYDKMAL